MEILHPLSGSHSSQVDLVRIGQTFWVRKTALPQEIANERAFVHAISKAGLIALQENTEEVLPPNQILLEYVQGSPVLGDHLTEQTAYAWGKMTRAMHAVKFAEATTMDVDGTKHTLDWGSFLEGLLRYGVKRQKKSEALVPTSLLTDMEKLLQTLVEQTPCEFSLLHGDYHSNNVLIRGEQLIPFDKASDVFSGDALYDLGFVLLDFLESFVTTQDPKELMMYDAFCTGYGGLSEEQGRRIEQYARLLAFVRFPSPFQPNLLEVIRYLEEKDRC